MGEHRRVPRLQPHQIPVECGGVRTIIDAQLKPGGRIATGRQCVPQQPGRPDLAGDEVVGTTTEEMHHGLEVEAGCSGGEEGDLHRSNRRIRAEERRTRKMRRIYFIKPYLSIWGSCDVGEDDSGGGHGGQPHTVKPKQQQLKELVNYKQL